MSNVVEIAGKYYDFGTDNDSFLQTAAELKTLDVKNFYFMLEIKNPAVADLDPYSDKLTNQQITMLAEEVKANMWYYVRQIAKIRSDRGEHRFGLHRGLAAALWSFDKRNDFCLCEPRQTWKTSGTIAGPVAWAFQTSTNLKLHFFGKESENTKRNLATLKDDIELLPKWIRQDKYKDDTGKVKTNRPSSEILRNPNLHNECVIHATATSLSKAQGMGRGASAAMIYFDEIEHTPYIDEILSNSAPAFKTASDNAKLAGKPYGRIMTSTPGNLDTKEGRTSMPIIKSMIPWTEKIYDMSDEQIAEYKSVYKDQYHADVENDTKREVIDVYYMEYQYYQVRKSHEWVLEQFALSGDKTAIRREILLQRLRGSTDSPISAEDIEYFISNMRRADRELMIQNKWLFKLFNHGQEEQYGRLPLFDARIPYLVGIDPASGGGGDNFAITVVNPYNMRIAAEFKNPYLDCPNAISMLLNLVHEHMPRAILMIERNSIGAYLIQLLRTTDLMDHIYWNEDDKEISQLAEETKEEFELRSFAMNGKKYGTYVNNKVKQAMFELLFQHINCCKDILTTEYLVDDMCKLVRDRTKSGKTTYRAAQGEHDDNVMSYLHAIYPFYTGNNLSVFGLDVESIPSVIGDFITDENSVQNLTSDGSNPVHENRNPNMQLSYDMKMIECMAGNDREAREQVNSSHSITDQRIKRSSYGSSNPYDESVEIPMSWFDMMNTR